MPRANGLPRGQPCAMQGQAWRSPAWRLRASRTGRKYWRRLWSHCDEGDQQRADPRDRWEPRRAVPAAFHLGCESRRDRKAWPMAAPQSGSSRAFGIRQRLRPTGRERRRRLCVDFTRERTDVRGKAAQKWQRSEEHTYELQSLIRTTYDV